MKYLIIILIALSASACGKRVIPVEDSHACQLLQQAFEGAEGMSPGWYGRTANTLIEECQYGDTRPKDFRL